MMKTKIITHGKRIACILAALTLLAGYGCGQAKEAPATVKTNTELLVAQATAASAQSGDRPLSERLGAPERYTAELTGAGGKLTISIDAPVVLPQGDLPILRVQAAEFTQEEVTKVFSTLCGDTPMFLSSDVMTKSEIEAAIAAREKNLEDESLQQTDRTFEEQMIAELRAASETAPETREHVQTDGTLQKRMETLGGKQISYSALDAVSEDGRFQFSVRNDSDAAEALTETTKENGKVVAWSTMPVRRAAEMLYLDNSGAQVENALQLNRRVEREDAIPADAAGLATAPAEAYDAAERLLEQLGLAEEMAVSDVFLTPGYYLDGSSGKPWCYAVFCTRMINGALCASLPNAQISTDERTQAEWGYESLQMTLTDEGISFFQWYAPLEVTGTESERAALKPFSDIAEIAESTLPLAYETHTARSYIEKTSVVIDRVTLSLQRISDQSQFDGGLLVPVWNFYGSCTDSRIHDETETICGTMLSINAVDGSVIDVRAGY
ncbi:MAG TPA: DUF6034 family protein [Feifaniaceae bacterium]|nr:DUF6034 family protein [Feifaniaceae bacterium]